MVQQATGALQHGVLCVWSNKKHVSCVTMLVPAPVPMQVCGKSGHCRVDKRKPTFSNIFILHSCVVCCSFLGKILVADYTRRSASSHRGCHRAIEPSSHRGLMPTDDVFTAFGHRAIEAPSSSHRGSASSFAIEPSRPGLSGLPLSDYRTRLQGSVSQITQWRVLRGKRSGTAHIAHTPPAPTAA